MAYVCAAFIWMVGVGEIKLIRWICSSWQSVCACVWVEVHVRSPHNRRSYWKWYIHGRTSNNIIDSSQVIRCSGYHHHQEWTMVWAMCIFYSRKLYESGRQLTSNGAAAVATALTSDELNIFPFRSTCVIQLIAVAYKHTHMRVQFAPFMWHIIYPMAHVSSPSLCLVLYKFCCADRRWMWCVDAHCTATKWHNA